MWFALPSRNSLDFCGPTAHFCLDLLAKLALGARRDCLHDELHATGFADSVLLGAVLSEVTPLPIATGKAVLVIEAHVSGSKSWDVWCLMRRGSNTGRPRLGQRFRKFGFVRSKSPQCR